MARLERDAGGQQARQRHPSDELGHVAVRPLADREGLLEGREQAVDERHRPPAHALARLEVGELERGVLDQLAHVEELDVEIGQAEVDQQLEALGQVDRGDHVLGLFFAIAAQQLAQDVDQGQRAALVVDLVEEQASRIDAQPTPTQPSRRVDRPLVERHARDVGEQLDDRSLELAQLVDQGDDSLDEALGLAEPGGRERGLPGRIFALLDRRVEAAVLADAGDLAGDRDRLLEQRGQRVGELGQALVEFGHPGIAAQSWPRSNCQRCGEERRPN